MTPEPARLRAKPRWQRARFLPGDGPLPASHEFWVMGPPQLRRMRETWEGSRGRATVAEHVPALRTNLTSGPKRATWWVRASCVETLGRGPEDFADHVALEDPSEIGPSETTVGVLVVVPAFGREGVDLAETLAGVKDAMIERALELAQGRPGDAAKLLGMGRTTLAEYRERRAQALRTQARLG